MAHHDAGEKVAQGRRSGIMTAGFIALIRNKAVPLDRRAKLQPMKRLAVNRRDGPLRLALFARPALGQLPRGDSFEVRLDFEHCILRFFAWRKMFSFSA